MAVITKSGKSWWIDYYLHGQRFRKRVGQNKKLAEEVLYQVKRKLDRVRARELLDEFYEIGGNGCQVCGYVLMIEKHHFIPRLRGGSNSPGNLIRLCPNHHRLLHLALQVLNNKERKKDNQERKEQLKRALELDEDFAFFYQRNAIQLEQIKKS